MENTLLVGDYLFINKMLYGSEIDLGIRGHQFVHYRFPAFRQPAPATSSFSAIRRTRARNFIKRCVAVGGQTVMIRNKNLYVDGVRLVEPYAIHIDPRILPVR